MFADELARYGPEAPQSKRPSRGRGRRYCRRLAKRHYENFTVANWLLPRGLRQHFCNVYAYCRWADDLADETGDPRRSLDLLDWWEGQLHKCYAGQSHHPVFVALADTIRKFEIPSEPFVDLLVAFRQDQRVTRYENFDQLLEYCRYSANPVGRLVLYLGQCHTPERVRLADSICTGLQLANFWQDVARDWDRGRIYLPQADCRRFGYDESDFARRQCNGAFRRLLAAQVDQAEIHERIEELYAHFAGWDASARREHLGGFEKFGHAAVKPLVRVLESYRQPDGAAEAYELKACVAEQLGRLGDSRAVPYLIQHLGTSTDEAGAAAFRAAAVRAIWQLALAGDPREEIAAVQAWWDKSGRRRYDKLTL